MTANQPLSRTNGAGREPQLAGQTVVVIGGSSGIGLETARRAREQGAEVIITARDPDRLHRLCHVVGTDHVRPPQHRGRGGGQAPG